MLRVEETHAPVTFSPELSHKCDEIVSRYPAGQQKSALLPIPQAERNLNPNIQQNPGW